MSILFCASHGCFFVVGPADGYPFPAGSSGSGGSSAASGDAGNGGVSAGSGGGGDGGAINFAGTAGQSTGGSSGVQGQWVPFDTLQGCSVEEYEPSGPHVLSWTSCTETSFPGCERTDLRLGGWLPGDTITVGHTRQTLDTGTSVLIGVVMHSDSAKEWYWSVFKDDALFKAFRIQYQDGGSCMFRAVDLADGVAVAEVFHNDGQPSGLLSLDTNSGQVTSSFVDFSPALAGSTYSSLTSTTWLFASALGLSLGSVSASAGGAVTKIASTDPSGPVLKWGQPTAGPDFFFVNQVYLEDGVPFRQRITKTDGLTEPVPYLSPSESNVDVGAAWFAQSHIVWKTGVNLVDPTAYGYEKVEMWASPYAEDSSLLMPTKLGESTNHSLSVDSDVAGWGHFATLGDMAGQYFVWNLNTSQMAEFNLNGEGAGESLFVHKLFGLTQTHVYMSAMTSSGENAGSIWFRGPIP